MIDRQKFIGLESEERFIDVEAGQLRLFAKAVAEKDPVYTDEARAKAAGHRGLPAPLTFAMSLGSLAPAKKGSLAEMGVEIGRLLHGEQKFTYHTPIYAGDKMRLKTTTVDIYDKKGGALEFVVQETTAHNQDGALCVTGRSVLVVRNPEPT